SEVWVVDDDKIICLLTRKHLQKYTTLPLKEFPDGKAALDHLLLAPATPVLVLLDINMPVMNGWDFLEEVNRRNLPHLQVIMVSSSINTHDKATAMSYPQVIDYLQKPLRAEDFKKLAEMLE